MQYDSNKFGAQTQLVLGAASSSSSSSLFGGSFSRPFIRSTNKSTSVFALVKSRISMQKQRKLTKMGLRKGSDLRAQFQTREANGEGRGKPVISAPLVALQQHPLASTNGPAHDNQQPSSQPPIRHSRLGQRHESLGSHPVHIPSEDSYNGDDSTSCDSVLSDWETPRDTPSSSPGDICPVHSVRDEKIRQLCKETSLSREEQEELMKAIMDLELHIKEAIVAANMYFRQAHRWEVRSPIPNDLDSLPQILQGLRTVMIWMQQRIQVYETLCPGLREQYDAERGLND